ncbi:MAG TPA: hypothetical protein DIT13_04610 [Verrucomicrobiales bacterium]|nr:hypothetical protein [Verrucomicrobiales bacterium]HRJ10607.1 hypothetical protein [Prosthecobacter sp.]HRK14671.1 hypothetical protein [Prosthecobacter sp.]
MKTAAVLIAALGCIFCAASCDSHSFESTQVLHEGMHKAHGDDHGGGHGKADDAHGQKPAKH